MDINIVKEVAVCADNLLISKNQILNLLGYNIDQPEEIIEKSIVKSIDESRNLIFPKAGYIILKKESHEITGEIKTGDIILKVNKIVASQIKKADYFALFICTIGNQVERKSSDLMNKHDMLDGYILNLIGSEAAEAVADIVHKEIGKTAKNEGLNITNRYSPGYCKWNVEEQFKLFSLFPENFCGISLTESALMDPVKSVSGIIGIGEAVFFKQYKCVACDDKNCIYRGKQV